MNYLSQVFLRIIGVLIIIFSSVQLSSAQEGQTIYTAHSKTRIIDHSEYDEIKGSPYLYDSWVSARILGSDGTFFNFDNVNFNGFTHQLEVKTNGLIEEIISASYLKAIVGSGNSENTFMSGLHPDLGQNIICILYDGKNVKLIKKFDVRIEESVAQTPGIPTVFTKFSVSQEYFIMIERDLSKTKLKKKSVISILGYKTELEKYIKQERLNLNRESDVVLLLIHYESDLIH